MSAKKNDMRDEADKILARRYDLKPGEAMDPATGEIVTADQAAKAGIVVVKPQDAAAMEDAKRVAMAEENDDFYAPELAIIDMENQVTIPVLKWAAGQDVICQFTDVIRKGKDLKALGKSKMEAPNVVPVKNVRGAKRTLVLGTILHEEITTAYKNDSYVGLWFMMTKLPKRTYVDASDGATKTKDYYEYLVIQIKDPSANLITREGRRPAKQITEGGPTIDAMAESAGK